MESNTILDSTFFQHLDLLSSIATESFYVIDVTANRFCYISQNNHFLCGHFVEKAFIVGDGVWKEIVYPDDLQLWGKIRKAVLSFLKDFDNERDEIDHFSCTFRLQQKFSFSPRPLPQTILHRMKPIWTGTELHYLLCFVGSSTTKKSGNLHIHYKDGLTCKEYNTKTQRWKQKTMEPITERERAILMLARQGKSVKEIANDLHRGFHTVRNQITALFQKFKTNSIQETIDFAVNYRMLCVPKEVMKKNETFLLETTRKKRRILLTDDMLQRIQEYLDDGKSIRQAAKLEGIAESAIRYWINKRRLRNCSNATIPKSIK